mgnify:CR=1 FL=1
MTTVRRCEFAPDEEEDEVVGAESRCARRREAPCWGVGKDMVGASSALRAEATGA